MKLQRILRWLAHVLSGWAERLEARAFKLECGRRLQPGTVVVYESGECACAKPLPGREWAVACWNGSDYSLRGIENGVASYKFGMEYACDRVKLRDTGRKVPVER